MVRAPFRIVRATSLLGERLGLASNLLPAAASASRGYRKSTSRRFDAGSSEGTTWVRGTTGVVKTAHFNLALARYEAVADLRVRGWDLLIRTTYKRKERQPNTPIK
jgi:hypothetical protein